jgi:fused signal recognition particle receptor
MPTLRNHLPRSEPTKQSGWLARLAQGLSKSSSRLVTGISDIVARRKLDDGALADLEDLLIIADMGGATAARLTDVLAATRFGKDVSGEEIREALAGEITKTLEPVTLPLAVDPAHKPFVVLVVGVNGAGKTTTIGKLAQQFRREGLSAPMAAGDTFRAAAVEQLQIWGERTGSSVMARETGADAAGLAFDAFSEARKRGDDVLLVDTAGRLQNKGVLMEELQKIVRAIKKIDTSAPHATLLVLDATVGQNAHSQVEVFKEMAGVTGLVMTKLDGTAKGGVVVALAEKFKLPIHYIGVGEGADDLRPFTARSFARGLMGLSG